MGQTIVEKIVSRQVGRPVRAGELIDRLPIGKLFFNDVIGPPAILTLHRLFGDTFKKHGKPVRVFDSRPCTNGAMGALAFGVGTTDGAYAMATGHIYDFVVPETFQFELTRSFQKGVYAKDLILHIIGTLGAGGCSRRVAEFVGDGVARLSMDARTTICNMAVEMSARTGIMPYDE